MEEIVFHHTLPIQLRFNDVDKFGHVNNTVYFSFYDLGKTEYFASVCPGVDWEKTGIVVVHRRTDCRFRSRNEKLSSAPTGDRHKDERDKMYLQINHGDFRPGETWVHASDGGMDRSDLQVWRQGFKKEEIKTYTSQYQASSFQPYHIGKSWFSISHIYSRTPTGSESLFIIRV